MRGGITIGVCDYGAIIVSILAPDRNGIDGDIVLGHDRLEGYLDNRAYLGAVIGRVANRIAGATFRLEGTEHLLVANEGANTLHGGARGFDRALWHAEAFQTTDAQGVRCELISPDGDQGFPGEVTAQVTYTLNARAELSIDYQARTSRTTLVNMTQHSYFNLSGRPAQTILDHVALIAARTFLPVDDQLLPTGEMRRVDATAFDFRQPRSFGERIHADDLQIRVAQGYDHCFVLDDDRAVAARVEHPASGRILEVETSEPGLQLYTGNQLDGSVLGKGDIPYAKYSGFALETQHFPDSANQPDFPTIVLRPSATLHSRTVYRFTVRPVRSESERDHGGAR